LREPNHPPTWPQDAGFLAGDGGDGGAEPLGVVERNVGDDGEERIYDVGCVEAAAHTNLEHREFNLCLGKIDEGQRGEDFKEAGVLREAALLHELLRRLVNAEVEAGEVIVGNLGVIDADALVDALQMRRGVEADVRAGGGEDGGQCGCRGAFAVGSGDEHGAKMLMRVAEGGKQGAELVEREFSPRLARARVQLRRHGVELIDGGGVGHER
jgi:hypothetical protein